jgi:hypothetical protein
MIWEVSFEAFSTDIPEGEQAIFFFALYKAGETGFDTTCHYFNVSRPRDASSTMTVSTSTSLAVETPTADPTSIIDDPNDNDEAGDKSGLSTGAVAGISVAATVAGLAALGALGFFLWRYLKGRPGGGSGGQYQPTPKKPEEYVGAELAGSHGAELAGDAQWKSPAGTPSMYSSTYGQVPSYGDGQQQQYGQQYGQPYNQQYGGYYAPGQPYPPQQQGPRLHEAP